MIKLVIFDVDGVMLDSETLYVDTAIEICEEYGYDIPVAAIKKSIGSGKDVQRKAVLEYTGPDFDYDTYLDHLKERMDYKRTCSPPAVKKGLFELLDYLKNKDIALALATSTDRKRQEFSLKKAEVYDYFDYRIYGDDINCLKPDPEIYLKVLEHFAYPKEEVLIIEDSINGILSAVNAGVRVIYIPDIVDVPEETVNKTFRKLNDLSECIGLIEELNKE